MSHEDPQFLKYRVWIRSMPGFFTQYDGKLDVWARDASEAEDNAYLKLRRGAFPDRDRSMWRTEKVECLGSNG